MTLDCKLEGYTKTVLKVMFVLACILTLFTIGFNVYANKFLHKNRADHVIKNNQITASGDYKKHNILNPAETNNKNQQNSTVLEEYIILDKKNNNINLSFKLLNMLPGDNQTNRYSLTVYHKGEASISISFNKTVQDKQQNLDRVLNLEIYKSGLPVFNNTASYLSENPVSLRLAPTDIKATKLDFEIRASLPLETGNEYQNNELIGDLVWSTDGDLTPPPGTGDNSRIYILGLICYGSTILLIISAKKGWWRRCQPKK